MQSKSSEGRVIDNTPADGATPMLRAVEGGAPGPSVGSGGTDGSVPFRKGSGYEGPGVGSAKRMNSDDAPVGPSYPNG